MRLLYKILTGFKSLDAICKTYKVISFDIFDTLIVRSCVSPETIFHIVQDLYNKENSVNISNFCQNRIVAERTARITSLMEEVSIDDIFNCLSSFYDIETCNKLKFLEIIVELEQCSARPEICDIYNKCISEKEVYIVSDMYLPIDIIRQILQKNGIKQPKKIYLSCKEKKTKRQGSLFKLLLQENDLKAKDVLHIGDNIKSDFLRPKLLGMSAYWIEKNNH